MIYDLNPDEIQTQRQKHINISYTNEINSCPAQTLFSISV